MPTILQGRYSIQARVGEGGFGTVYKAIDQQQNDLPVAIKEIKLRGLAPQEAIEATETFNREVQILSQLSHPSLPYIYDSFTYPADWYLVMDFIEGRTLEEDLQDKGGTLPCEEVIEIGLQLCEVLDYLHTRQPAIIFRDLKPANIMLTPYRQVYLIDFGTARFFKPGRLRDTITFGSPGYAAPEQYGKAQTTPRSDIYSLGATLHSALTGKDPAESPFDFVPLRTYNATYPANLEQLIARMVEKKAGNRPENMQEVKRELLEIRAEQKLRQYSLHSNHTAANYTPVANPGQAPPADWATSPPSLAQAQMQLGLPVTPPPTTTRKIKISRRAAVSTVLALTITGPMAYTLGQYAGLNTESQTPPIKRSGDRFRFFAETITTYTAQVSAVNSLSWSPDGYTIASANQDGTVHLWQARSGRQTSIFGRHTTSVRSVVWSPDGQNIASVSQDGVINIWSPTTNEVIFKIPTRQEQNAISLTWSPDGTHLAIGSSDIKVWNIAKQEQVTTYSEHNAPITNLAWQQSRYKATSYIASGDQDGRIHIWDLYTGNWQISPQLIQPLYALSWFADDEHLVFAGGPQEQLYVWRLYKEGHPFVYWEHQKTDTVNNLAVSSQSTLIASATADGRVYVWERASRRRPLAIYREHHGTLHALAWSPNRRWLASVGGDGISHVWRLRERSSRSGNKE